MHVLWTRYIIDHHIQLAHDINLWVEEKLHDKRLFKTICRFDYKDVKFKILPIVLFKQLVQKTISMQNKIYGWFFKGFETIGTNVVL